MEKENTAQAEPAGNGAEARKEEARGGFGKFKSADALLNAYNSLEAEFTRRSQRLRELEGRENCAQPRGESAPAAEGDAAIEERIERAVEARDRGEGAVRHGGGRRIRRRAAAAGKDRRRGGRARERAVPQGAAAIKEEE